MISITPQSKTVILISIYVLMLVICAYATNSFCSSLDDTFYSCYQYVFQQKLPSWFDSDLKDMFRDKISRDFSSKQLNMLNMLYGKVKPSAVIVSDPRWRTMESYLQLLAGQVKKRNVEISHVVGILSGGGFIANGMAKYLHVPKKNVSYVKLSRYGHSKGLLDRVKVYFSSQQKVVLKKTMNFGKFTEKDTVLIIDDNCATGSTLKAAKNLVIKRGAKKVLVSAIASKIPLDFCVFKNKILLMSPWGCDA